MSRTSTLAIHNIGNEKRYKHLFVDHNGDSDYWAAEGGAIAGI